MVELMCAAEEVQAKPATVFVAGRVDRHSVANLTPLSVTSQ